MVVNITEPTNEDEGMHVDFVERSLGVFEEPMSYGGAELSDSAFCYDDNIRCN